jgi:hypothetical protein
MMAIAETVLMAVLVFVALCGAVLVGGITATLLYCIWDILFN